MRQGFELKDDRDQSGGLVRCLTRYILFELVKVFLLSLAGMTLVVLLGVVGQEAIRKGLSPANVLRLVPYALPIALLYAVPATTLLAACNVFGRISAANEIVAIKSVGISPMALVWPTLVWSFLLSLLVVALNDVAVTWGREGVKRVAVESVEQIAYGMLRTQQSYRCRRFSIHVQGVDGHQLVRPTLTIHGQQGRPPTVIMAEAAELWANLEEDALSIALTDWWVDDARGEGTFPGREVIHFPLSEAAYKTDSTESPSDVALRRIAPEVERQLKKIEHLEQSFAAEAAYQMLAGDFARLLASDWGDRRSELDKAKTRLHRLYTEPWRRWANGFSCMAFVLVGVPLAVRLRNSDMWTSFAACFLPILAVYYPLMAYGLDQAKSGAMPPYSVWLGNLILAAAGAWLLKNILRY